MCEVLEGEYGWEDRKERAVFSGVESVLVFLNCDWAVVGVVIINIRVNWGVKKFGQFT
jgi:hypothetical protein